MSFEKVTVLFACGFNFAFFFGLSVGRGFFWRIGFYVGDYVLR